MADAPEMRSVVLDARSVLSIDVSASERLDRLARVLGERGVVLRIAGVAGQVHDVVETFSHGSALTHLHPNVDSAVEAAGADPA